MVLKSGMGRRKKRKGPTLGREMEGAKKKVARPSTEFFSKRCDWVFLGATVDTWFFFAWVQPWSQ